MIWRHKLRTSGTVTVLSTCFEIDAGGRLSPQPADLPAGVQGPVVSVLEAVPANYERIEPPAPPAEPPAPPAEPPAPPAEPPVRPSPRLAPSAPRGRPLSPPSRS